MRVLPLLVAITVGCNSGSSTPGPLFIASGSLQFNPRQDGDADAYLQREIDTLRSDAFVQSVSKRFPQAKLAADSVGAVRRPGTMILDIAVSAGRSEEAVATCNHVMQTYIELHLHRHLPNVTTLAACAPLTGSTGSATGSAPPAAAP